MDGKLSRCTNIQEHSVSFHARCSSYRNDLMQISKLFEWHTLVQTYAVLYRRREDVLHYSTDVENNLLKQPTINPC